MWLPMLPGVGQSRAHHTHCPEGDVEASVQLSPNSGRAVRLHGKSTALGVVNLDWHPGSAGSATLRAGVSSPCPAPPQPLGGLL